MLILVYIFAYRYQQPSPKTVNITNIDKQYTYYLRESNTYLNKNNEIIFLCCECGIMNVQNYLTCHHRVLDSMENIYSTHHFT